MIAAPDLIGLRAYQPDDLARVLRFVGECCAQADCGCLHPGDVVHHMSSSLRGRDQDQYVYVYEVDGMIQALVLLSPARYGSIEAVIHPTQRSSDLEGRLFEWAQVREQTILRAAGSTHPVSVEVPDCDESRQRALRGLGYQADARPSLAVTERSLTTPTPASILPDGFTIRSAAGEHEAALLSEVHMSAFNSNWTPEEYLRVMRTPGFEIERELVVVAPDGRFAAFLIYWPDPVSKSALFEPVGCHKDFQRRGLTRALMYEGMRRMVACGMTTAIVLHKIANEAATGLYHSVGFKTKYTITSFCKTVG